MARFSGKIGISRGPQESVPGVYSEEIIEIEVSGEMRGLGARWSNMSSSETRLRHVLSIITPEESDVDINEVVYIWWKGRRWSVVNIEYKRPRVELTLGGLYNG